MTDRITAAIIAAPLFVAGCTGVLAEARDAVDVATAAVVEANQKALVEVQRERLRLRRLRCHNPMLTPNAVSTAADNPELGPDWIDELLDDCPRFRGFVDGLMMRRARSLAAGIAAE